MHTWHSSPIYHGDKQGRTISFPTINLDPNIWPADQQPGVYSVEVRIGEPATAFQGALYYGPRTIQGETHNILEIYLLDFSQQVYGQTASFRLHKFIRPVIHFNSFEEMKPQIAQDVEAVRASFEQQLEKSDEA